MLAQEILLKAQRDVFSRNIGENSTKIKGEGYDFIELREYESGDDIRHIDWIISSKLGKPFVKQFAQERELNLVIVAFLSASLHFGSQRLKKELLIEVCALLSMSANKQKDPFCSFACTKKVIPLTLRSKSKESARAFVQKLTAFDVKREKLLYENIMQGLYASVTKASLMFLVGDFLETQNLNLQALSSKHELLVIIVRDRFEEEPQALGKIEMIDPQSQKQTSIDLSPKNVELLKMQRKNADKIFEEELKVLGISFIKIYTDEDPARKIISMMAQQ